MSDVVKGYKPEKGRNILIPGDPEYHSEARRIKSGIPVDSALLKELNEWSDSLGVNPAPFLVKKLK